MSKRQKLLNNSRKYATKLFWDTYEGQMVCVYCKNFVSRHMVDGDPLKATVDHVISLTIGGESKYDNLVLSCFHCNQKRAGHNVSK